MFLGTKYQDHENFPCLKALFVSVSDSKNTCKTAKNKRIKKRLFPDLTQHEQHLGDMLQGQKTQSNPETLQVAQTTVEDVF